MKRSNPHSTQTPLRRCVCIVWATGSTKCQHIPLGTESPLASFPGSWFVFYICSTSTKQPINQDLSGWRENLNFHSLSLREALDFSVVGCGINIESGQKPNKNS